MYHWSLSSETRLPLCISCLIERTLFNRHTLEMDALRKTYDVHAAKLSEQVTQLQVKPPFTYL